MSAPTSCGHKVADREQREGLRLRHDRAQRGEARAVNNRGATGGRRHVIAFAGHALLGARRGKSVIFPIEISDI